MDTRTIQASLILSALGWIAAVVAVAAVLFGAKPYYENTAYEAGRQARAQENITRVDEWILTQVSQDELFAVQGRVVSTTADSVTFETLTPRLNNPLRPQRRQQTARIDADTLLEKRSLVSTTQTQQYESEPITINQLQIGDEITVIPRLTQEVAQDIFAAKQILRTISPQETTS